MSPNGDTHIRVFGGPRNVANIKAYEMLANSHFFLRDARALASTGSAGQFFLYAHAIELALKSFLHLHGISLEEVRKRLSHRLHDALQECRQQGLTIAPIPADDVLERIDKAMERAALRYDFNFEVPSLELMDQVAAAIHAAASVGQRTTSD